MKLDSHFCDVCGTELKNPAKVTTTVGEYTAYIQVTLNKAAGAYAEYCANCMTEALANSQVQYGELGSVKIVKKGGKTDA